MGWYESYHPSTVVAQRIICFWGMFMWAVGEGIGGSGRYKRRSGCRGDVPCCCGFGYFSIVIDFLEPNSDLNTL